MLNESEVQTIRRGIRDGVRGPVMLKWLDQLLKERDEFVKRDREIAAALLRENREEEGA